MREIKDTDIGHYHLERLLARGGMSNVHLAHDTLHDRMVAIKLVSKDEGNYCERFQREAAVTANLTHDHILPIFDSGDYDSWCYMVMPYIEDGTLRDRLKEGPLTPREAGQILAQLANAVQFAHDRGIIHRDIKPSNILLRDGIHVYLADFGLVRHISDADDLTLNGTIMGTPEYMAPELIEQAATPTSDIYAIGVVLYQMLTGHLPFKGSTPIGIYWKHLREHPLAPSLLNPGLSHAIDKVILRALEKNPQRRFKSVNELALAYQRVLILEARRKVVGANAILSSTSVFDDVTATLRYNRSLLPSGRSTRPLFPSSLSLSLPMLKKTHAKPLLVCLLLFILPTLLGFSVSQFYSHAQEPTLLGAGGSFTNNPTATQTPIAHGTSVPDKPPVPISGSHITTTTLPTTVNPGGSNPGHGDGDGDGDDGHEHHHHHGHGDGD